MKFAAVYNLVPDSSFEETIKRIKRAGYDGIEISQPPLFEGRARPLEEKEMKGLCERARACAEFVKKEGLEFIGFAPGYFCLSYFDDAVFENYYRLAQALGAPTLKVYGTLYDPKQGYRKQFKENQRKLGVLLGYGEKYGVRSLLELHFGTLNESCSGAYLVCKDFDPKLIGVIPDPQNMVIAGKETWRMGLEILGSYIAYVHWKNSLFKKGADNQWEWQLCDMDEGLVNWKDFVQSLQAVGFTGYLCNEYRGDTKNTPSERYLEGDLNYMKSLL